MNKMRKLNSVEYVVDAVVALLVLVPRLIGDTAM